MKVCGHFRIDSSETHLPQVKPRTGTKSAGVLQSLRWLMIQRKMSTSYVPYRLFSALQKLGLTPLIILV
jgi:hypothetical protein